jgi:hypothetical protein
MPLAADSLGVRSMATYVEAGPVRLLLDPGVTLSPGRYALPPAAEEIEALGRARARIAGYATRSTLIVVSHYHADHCDPAPQLYADRRVWAKDPRRMLDAHQAERGRRFWRGLGTAARLEAADGRLLELGDVQIRVSPPLAHGREGSGFGSVVAVTVDDGLRFVYAPDAQGPASAVVTAYILRERPDLVYLSGPATYLEAHVGRDAVRHALENLLRLVSETGCRVIVDHHAVRDRRYRERLGPAFATGRVVTVAEYLGCPEACLEARRPQLWRQAPGGGAASRGKERVSWPS